MDLTRRVEATTAASPAVQTVEASTAPATAASTVESGSSDPTSPTSGGLRAISCASASSSASPVCLQEAATSLSETAKLRAEKRESRKCDSEEAGALRLKSNSALSPSASGASEGLASLRETGVAEDSQRPFKDQARKQRTPCGLPRVFFLVLLLVYTLLTGKVFSGWPSLSNLLFREGAFLWLCRDSAKPAPGDSEAVCDLQLLAVNKLFAICLATSFSFSFVAGFLLDRVGPKATAIAGNFISFVGWTLLGFCGEELRAFEVAFAFISMGGDLAFMPVISVANLFPEREGLIIALLGGARSLSYGIPLVLEAMNEHFGMSLEAVCCGFAVTGPGLCLIFAVTCVPLRRFSSWTDLLVEAAEAEAAADVSSNEECVSIGREVALLNGGSREVPLQAQPFQAQEQFQSKSAFAPRPRPLRLLTYDFGLLGHSECVRGSGVMSSEALGSPGPSPRVLSPKHSVGNGAPSLRREDVPSLKSISRRLSAVHFTADDSGEAKAFEEEPSQSLQARLLKAHRFFSRGVVIAYNSNKLQRRVRDEFAEDATLQPADSTPSPRPKTATDGDSCEISERVTTRSLKFQDQVGLETSAATRNNSNFSQTRLGYNRRCATLPPSTASMAVSVADSQAVNAARRVVRLYRLQSFYVPGLQEDALVERMVQKGSVLARASAGSLAIPEEKLQTRATASKADGEEHLDNLASEVASFVPAAPPKIQSELISGFFAGLVVFFSMHALLYAYFATNSALILGPQFNRLLGVCLPLTFVPSIVLGRLVDCIGILWVMFLLQVSVSGVYALAASTSDAARATAVLFYCVFVSFHASSTYCFVGDTFRASHMGTLAGLVFMIGGLLSLLKIPLQATLADAFGAASSRGPLCLLSLCFGGFVVWGCLFFLKQKDAHPFWPSKAKEAAALLESQRKKLRERRNAALKRNVKAAFQRLAGAYQFPSRIPGSTNSRKKPDGTQATSREFAVRGETQLDAFV